VKSYLIEWVDESEVNDLSKGPQLTINNKRGNVVLFEFRSKLMCHMPVDGECIRLKTFLESSAWERGVYLVQCVSLHERG